MNALNLRDLVAQTCYLSPDLRLRAFQAIEGGRAGSPPNISYPAAQALWYLLGAQRASWEPFAVDHDGVERFFLRHRGGSLYLNPTFYEGESTPPYEDGRPTRFVSSWPCGRAFKIIERAGFDWPLDQGESVCPACRGSGEDVRVLCEGCDRPRSCLACSGSGINQNRPAMNALRY